MTARPAERRIAPRGKRMRRVCVDKKVSAYIGRQKPPQREILGKLRDMIRRAAPLAAEGMRYGVPAFTMNGRSVLYAAFKGHVGLYPEPETIKAFRRELEPYETSRGTIQFRLDEPIPYGLIGRIVGYRFKSGTTPAPAVPGHPAGSLPKKGKVPDGQ